MSETHHIKAIAVFCGANIGRSSIYAHAANQLADALYNANITLVYGGAQVGIMGVLADRMLSNGGKVIGVLPKAMLEQEVAHTGLTKLHIVNSMHERKALMAQSSDGFIMLPGGPGSLDEFFEIYTWAKLGYHCKPCAILNVHHYYDHLLKLLDHAQAEGFMQHTHRHMIVVENNPSTLIQRLVEYSVPQKIT